MVRWPILLDPGIFEFLRSRPPKAEPMQATFSFPVASEAKSVVAGRLALLTGVVRVVLDV